MALRAARLAAPDWVPEWAAAAIAEAIDSAGSTIFVAIDGDDGAIVGICTAYIDLLSVRYGLRCWVEDLAVDPRIRSRGVGPALLGAARRWAAEPGASTSSSTAARLAGRPPLLRA